MSEIFPPTKFMEYFTDQFGPAAGRKAQQDLISSVIRQALADRDTSLPGMRVPTTLRLGAQRKDYVVNFAVPLTDRRDGLRKVLDVMSRMSFYPSLVMEGGEYRKIVAGMVGKDQRLELYADEHHVFIMLPSDPNAQVLDFTQVPHTEGGTA